MSFQVSQERFDDLETPWNYLLSVVPGPTVFLTPTWHRVWWQHLGDGDLHLLSVRHDGRVVGIAPFMLQDHALRLLGGTDVVDYHDLPLEPELEAPALSALLDYLGSQPWDSLELTSLRERSPTFDLLPGLARTRGWLVEQAQEDVCPCVILPPTWDGYLNSLARKDRHELRRKLRRLYGEQDVKHYAVTSPEGVAQGMDDFFRLLRASREVKAQFLTPRREAFMRAMAIALAQEGRLYLFFMELSGVRVAAALCFYYGGQLSLYNSGYDPAYSSLSVGLLLKALCVREAIERGITLFDFLRGAEPYKYDLGGKDHRLWQLTVRRPNP
ncbi:MAG: GNAT family N-acetyltransferase [Chloroflexi bacterium]|nr:GNAT family N-acetyltransferase [Chloroflexota bacterium]